MSELSHLGAYRLIHQGRLTDAEAHALQVHLRKCEACRQHAFVAGVLYANPLLELSPVRPSPQYTAVYMESAARRSRRSQIMKPIYAVGGLAALALLVLAGWFIVRATPETSTLESVPVETAEVVAPADDPTETAVPPTEEAPPTETPVEMPTATDVPAETEGYSVLETIPSPSLSGAMFGSDEEHIAIYLPASYDGSDKRYPVLYIMPGLSDFFLEGAEVQSESLGWKMNAAFGRGPGEEMIVVFPDPYNSMEWGRIASDGPVNGNVLAYLAEDVVDFVDANYRTLPDPASRGLLGLDASGYDALSLIFYYPDVYGTLYLNHPWLLAPGGLEESRFAGPVARAALPELISGLAAMPREEAHTELLRLMEDQDASYAEIISMSYAWAFVADPDLNAPYFEYLYLEDGSPAGEAVWDRWEAGLGNLDQKVADNADSLRKLNAIGVSEALNDQMEPWAADGIHYLWEQLEANEIPFRKHTYEGTLEDVYEQLKNPILPFFSENLVFQE